MLPICRIPGGPAVGNHVLDVLLCQGTGCRHVLPPLLREGVCCSDGWISTAKTGWSVSRPLSDVVEKNNKAGARPFAGLPVIRDLVVDMSIFYKQYEKGSAVFAERPRRAGYRAHCSRRKSGETGWPVRVYSLCLLLTSALPF